MTTADYLTAEDLRARVKRTMRETGGLDAFARRCGVSPYYIRQVIYGGEPIGPKIAGAMGFERVHMYKPKGPS